MTTPRRADFRFTERHRVRWAEVDMQRIVFNGHYLMYFDTAVAAYWRAMAMPYHETMHALQGDFFVRKATLEYEASAHYDEQLDTGIRCARIGNSSMLLQAASFRGEQCLVHGELVYVFADPATQTSKPVPDSLRKWFTDFEAGVPMVELRLGDWAALGALAAPLRHAVFTLEQGIDAALDDDGEDPRALHALALNRMGLAIGTGRAVTLTDGAVKIGRMAVLASMRGHSVGDRLLTALVQAAREQGRREAMLHAQASAIGFYRRAGWQESGPPFEEAGIAHQKMVLRLS
jgi:YbgC/YbaW family acyl-CoA thioester hydrolase